MVNNKKTYSINKEEVLQKRRYRNRRTSTLLAFVFFLILAFQFYNPKLYALSNEKIVIEPPFQELTLDQTSDQKTIKIKIANKTRNKVDFNFQIVEIKQMDEQGNISFIDRPQTAENPLAWFIETPKSISVDPDQEENIEIKVTNSVDLEPGGHYAALIARANTENQIADTQVAPALSSFILIKKEGGVIYQMSLKPLENLGWILHKITETFELTFENQGNSHTIPRGTIEITDGFGRLLRKGIINESSSIVLPGSRRNIIVNTYEVNKTFPISINKVSVTGNTNPGDVKLAQTTSYIYVWPYIYGLMVIAVAVFSFAIFKIRKNKLHDK